MPEMYENLSPNGHESMLTRVFQKIKALFGIYQQEITLAQYNALSADKKNDDIEYFITDEDTMGITQCLYDSENEDITFVFGATYFPDTENIRIR